MASLGHTRAVARVMGVRLSGFPAWWVRRTYYLFQMPRWERRLRIVLDWTVALFFRPDITKVGLPAERERPWPPPAREPAASRGVGRETQP
jgi:NADH dehydrogenase